MTAENSHVT